MDHKKTVSVIIPAYKAEDFIALALATVWDQTYRPVEVVVVDDGSPDDTGGVVDYFCKTRGLVEKLTTCSPYNHSLSSSVKTWNSCDFEVQYLRQDNGGPSSARNAGIRLSTGEYIAFLDADDHWLPEKLEKQIKFRLLNNIDVVFSDFCIEKQGGDCIPSVAEKFNWILPSLNNEKGFWFKKLLEWNFVMTSTLLVRRNCFEKIDLFEEAIRHGEDYDLCLRLALFFKFGFFPEVTCIRKIHGENLTMDETKFYINKIFILKKLKNQFPEEIDRFAIDIDQYILNTKKEFSYFYYLKKDYLNALRYLLEFTFYSMSKYIGLRP